MAEEDEFLSFPDIREVPSLFVKDCENDEPNRLLVGFSRNLASGTSFTLVSLESLAYLLKSMVSIESIDDLRRRLGDAVMYTEHMQSELYRHQTHTLRSTVQNLQHFRVNSPKTILLRNDIAKAAFLGSRDRRYSRGTEVKALVAPAVTKSNFLLLPEPRSTFQLSHLDDETKREVIGSFQHTNKFMDECEKLLDEFGRPGEKDSLMKTIENQNSLKRPASDSLSEAPVNVKRFKMYPDSRFYVELAGTMQGRDDTPPEWRSIFITDHNSPTPPGSEFQESSDSSDD